MIKVAHLSDLHYCPKYLAEVDRCTGQAISAARARAVDCVVFSGDEFDHQIGAQSPAFYAFAKRVAEVQQFAPLFLLQGTFSHDAPGTLSVFRHFGGQFPVYVSERIEQVALLGDDTWVASEGYKFDEIPAGTKLLITSIPAINRAEIAARVGAENVALSQQDMVAELLASFAPINRLANARSIPTVLVSHGTVSNCRTEHGVPMAGLDHEFSVASLFSSGAKAIMLGHIHMHQTWADESTGLLQIIAYAGSIGRLHYGELGTKGWLLWSFGSKLTCEQVPVAARDMQDLRFPGLPDDEVLARAAAQCDGQYVRIRFFVDEEHRRSVDRNAILAMFKNAAEVQLEMCVNPITRARTSGVTALTSLADQLDRWAVETNSPAEGLRERLALLDQQPAEQIVASLIQGNAQPSQQLPAEPNALEVQEPLKAAA